MGMRCHLSPGSLLLLLFSGFAQFAPAVAEEIDTGAVIENEISGFTTDNTISRVAHDFARYLGEWRNVNISGDTYNLSVYERPSARWGNLIWVEHENAVVYRQFLQLRNSDIRDVAYSAARRIHLVIQQRKLADLLTDSPDLGGAEF